MAKDPLFSQVDELLGTNLAQTLELQNQQSAHRCAQQSEELEKEAVRLALDVAARQHVTRDLVSRIPGFDQLLAQARRNIGLG